MDVVASDRNMARPKHSPFFQLPLEIRGQIYHDVLLGFPRKDALSYDIDSRILRTCKQIHDEARPVLYRVNVFEAAVWLPVDGYTPWPSSPKNQDFLSRVQHLALYWDMRLFTDFEGARFESFPLRKSLLNLKRICIALVEAGSHLRTLRITMKAPYGIDFGHMPLGQYPLLTPLSPIMSQFQHMSTPDMLAPLKEIRAQKAIFAGDFSEATAKTIVYLNEVKAIIEGYKPESPWVFPELTELNLDLMTRRNLYQYCSASSHPSWQGTLHRELFFYTSALRVYYASPGGQKHASYAIEELDCVRRMLSKPETEKMKGFREVNLRPILLLLQYVFRDILSRRLPWTQNNIVPQDLIAARDYFAARCGIQKLMEQANLEVLSGNIPKGQAIHSYFHLDKMLGR